MYIIYVYMYIYIWFYIDLYTKGVVALFDPRGPTPDGCGDHSIRHECGGNGVSGGCGGNKVGNSISICLDI